MKEFKEGIYEDLSYEEYAEIPAHRSHDLTSIIKCPYTWKNKKALEQTPALLEGRVQHTVFLEHHKFDEEFVIQPNVDRRTKAGKADYEDFLASVGNRTPITQDLYDVCMKRRELVKDYIPSETDKAELTLVFEWHGAPFKARFDWYDGEYVWDLKTCRDASPRGFKQAINAFNYHMQAALYVDAAKALDLPAKGFKFLAQEKQDPFPYVVYSMHPEALKYAQARNEQALALIQECVANNDYKPYNLEGEQEIGLKDLY
jgi:exodeoxyribonuclease VIII|tara:strand:- start:759 stop:1535 length:777 start_codon:yes stop_codon:yes gene_type:complete